MKQGVNVGGEKIFGMVFLIIGGCLTIIGGILLGMFFLYPLGNVVPEEQYIVAYEEEYLILATILGLGIFFLILGFILESIAISEEYKEYRVIDERNNSNIISNLEITPKLTDISEKEIEDIMNKKIMSKK